jgi:hypothetical protein
MDLKENNCGVPQGTNQEFAWKKRFRKIATNLSENGQTDSKETRNKTIRNKCQFFFFVSGYRQITPIGIEAQTEAVLLYVQDG